jgi:hypothetical protein
MRAAWSRRLMLAIVANATLAFGEPPSGVPPEVPRDSPRAGPAGLQPPPLSAEATEGWSVNVLPVAAGRPVGYASYAATSKRRSYSVYGHHCCATFHYRRVFDYPWHGPAYRPVAHAPHPVAKQGESGRASDAPPAPLPPELRAGAGLGQQKAVRSSHRSAKTR